jgi:adenosylcobyric acid synthase
MLGERLDDPHGVEGHSIGLGLMPYRTEFLPAKTYRHGRYSLSELTGFWEPLSRLDFDGYEIHHGVTRAAAAQPAPDMRPVLSSDGGWQRGNLLALYPHGLLENTEAFKALFGADTPTLDDVMDGLADFIEGRFARDVLMSYVDGP